MTPELQRDAETARVYDEARIGTRIGRGGRPAVLVVDFVVGFTDTACALGSELDAEVAATRRLLDLARSHDVPVIFTTIVYGDDGEDSGVWLEKMPALSVLTADSKWIDIDPRLDPQPGEPVIVKKGASALFGTNLASVLASLRVDTVVLCGATTSGCIRASAVDLLQAGFRTLVPRECVGDRAQGPHEANLVDIDAKYGDVIAVEDAERYLADPAGLATLAGRFHEAYNAHDAAAAAALYAPRGRHVDVPMNSVSAGPEAIEQGLAHFLRCFADARWTPSAPIVGDGVVTIPYRLTGTLAERLGPFEPRGQQLDLAGVHVLVAPSGAIIESLDHWDRATLERQLAGPA
jgi:maleamate amidohydrolase